MARKQNLDSAITNIITIINKSILDHLGSFSAKLRTLNSGDYFVFYTLGYPAVIYLVVSRQRWAYLLHISLYPEELISKL